MTRRLPQSTAYTVTMKVFLTSDHITPATSKTVAITISKAGGAFGNPAAGASTATEISGGWYKFALGTGDTDTLGDLIVVGTASSCDPSEQICHVVAATNGGMTSMPAVASGSAGGLIVQGTGTTGLDVTSGRVDTGKISGTTQTPRDLGASVLLSSGTGTGQLDFTSGVVKSSLVQILGTALTETSGQIAAAFKKFFDKGSPTGTINSIPDAVAGATGGLFIAGTNAATTITTALTTTFTGNLTGSVASVTAGVTLAASAVQAIWDALTSALTTVGSIGKLLVDNITGNAFTRLGAPAGASVSADIAAAKADTVAVKIQTDKLAFTVPNQLDVNVLDWKSATAPAMTGDAFARLGAPVGASVSADIAAAKADTAAVKAKTDSLPSDPADASDILSGTNAIFNRIGAPVGASISADIAAVQADTDNIQTRIPAALVSGRMDASVGAMAANTLTASALATDAVTEITSGLSTLDAAGIRTAVGLASANLDTQLGTIDDFLDTEIAAIKAKTDNIPSAPAAVGDIPTANQNADALFDRANGIETGVTFRQSQRIQLAALSGKADGLAGTTVHYRDPADSKNRITATVDENGNRTAVTLDAA